VSSPCGGLKKDKQAKKKKGGATVTFAPTLSPDRAAGNDNDNNDNTDNITMPLNLEKIAPVPEVVLPDDLPPCPVVGTGNWGLPARPET